MVIYEDECVGCPYCINCGRKSVAHFYCDICGREIEDTDWLDEYDTHICSRCKEEKEEE